MKKLLTFVLCFVLLMGCMVFTTSCGSKKYIGVQSGTTGQYFVSGDKDWGFEGLKGYEAKTYNNGGLAVSDMKAGVVQYVIIDQAPALQLAKSISGVKVINIGLTDEEYAFGVDPAQAELLNLVNEILKNKSEEINAIIEKYFNGGEVTPVVSAKKDLDKADKQLVVATNAEFSPFEYTDGDKYVGIDIEIMKLIADELGMELVIENMDFEAVVTSVGKNGIDIAAAGLTVDDTRRQSVNFTSTYYKAAQVLITLESDTSFDSCETAEDVLKQLSENLK